ncbi:hypothetical protein MY8738_008651 [Beauveria namnaoensis]
MPPKVLLIECGPEDNRGKYLLDNDWQPLVKVLTEHAELKTVKSADGIESTMKAFKPSAIVVMEGGLDSLCPNLIAATSKFRAFAEEGGIVFYGGVFSSVATKFDMETIFGEMGFNVGWKYNRYIGYYADGWDGKNKGNYDKLVKASLNREAEVFLNNSLNLQSAQLPDEIDPFRPLVVEVTNPAHVLYKVVDPLVVKNAEKHGVGVMAPFGAGFVGFWSDRDNRVAQAEKVIPAMLGLTPKQQQ